MTEAAPPHVLVMGVSGVGKTSLGRALAAATSRRFVDADDHHSAASIARMARGEPLTEAHRAAWLDRVGAAIGATNQPCVLACSALRAAHRAQLAPRLGAMIIIHLTGPRGLLAERIAARSDHFMPLSLLDSQLATLEAPAPGPRVLSLDVTPPLEQVHRQAMAFLNRENGQHNQWVLSLE